MIKIGSREPCTQMLAANTVETNIDPLIARESQDFFHVISGSVIDRVVRCLSFE
jgi:hypothetical protein